MPLAPLPFATHLAGILGHLIEGIHVRGQVKLQCPAEAEACADTRSSNAIAFDQVREHIWLLQQLHSQAGALGHTTRPYDTSALGCTSTLHEHC